MRPSIKLYSLNIRLNIRIKIFASQNLDFVLGEHNSMEVA